jgi:rhamnose transport system permease protein
MALPLTLVIIAAEIDLSVASVLALSSALMADLWNQGLPLELIMPICIVVGGLCGAFNGFLVTRLGLPMFGSVPAFPGDRIGSLADRGATVQPEPWWQRWRFRT